MGRVLPAVGVALILAGCAHETSSTYDSSEVGRPIDVSQATVVAGRTVQVTGAGDANVIGPAAGAAVGAAATGLGYGGGGSGWAVLLGGLAGAGAGYVIQSMANNREGIEYILRMDDGRTVTVVQNRENLEAPLVPGTAVLVQMGGKYSRVIPDPSPQDRSMPPASSGGSPDPGPSANAGTAPAGAYSQAPSPSSGSWRQPPATSSL